MPNKRSDQNIWKKAARITARIILFTVLFVFLLILSINLPFVQRIIRQKTVAYLENKLDTKVSIGKIYVKLPNKIELKDVYIEDRQQDTLLSAAKMSANINLWKLAFKNDLQIKSIGLDDVTAKIRRQYTDSAFNYQFIVDAFMPTDTSTSAKDSTINTAVSLGHVTLNKIKLLYKDAVTGSSVSAYLNHLETRVDVFDPTAMNFDIPVTEVNGLQATISQVKPLANPKPFFMDSIEASMPAGIRFAFKHANLKDVTINYRNEVDGLFSTADIGTLTVQPDNIDMVNQVLDIRNLRLENSEITIRLTKKEQAAIIAQKVVQETESLLAVGWKIKVQDLYLVNNNFQLNDENVAFTKQGMDYAHIDLRRLTLKASDILLNDDTATGHITEASFTEKGGFQLEELRTNFLYTSGEASLNNLYLKTPGTELKHTAIIRFASPTMLTNDIGSLNLAIELEQSKLLVKDLLTFAPQLKDIPAFAYPNTTWFIDSRINGRISDLKIDKLKLQGLQDTKIDVEGSITGLPDINKLQANLFIRNISSPRKDINLFIPAGSLPDNITLPTRFNANGRLTSKGVEMSADLQVNTDLGNASVKGTFQKIANATEVLYNVTVNTNNLDLGVITQNKEIQGPVSATFTASGKGYDPKTANTNIDGIIHSANIHQYNYKNVDVHAAIANQQAIVKAGINDPNIDLDLNGTIDFTTAFPALQISGMVDSIKFQPLHLSSQHMIFRGKIDANIPVSDPDNLDGKIYLTQALFVQDQQRLNLDSVELIAGRSEGSQFLQLNSDIMSASLRGMYQLSELPVILQNAVQPYFTVAPATTYASLKPYNFQLNAIIKDNPALASFVPGLERIDSVFLRSNFSDSGWTATLTAAAIDINNNQLRQLNLQAGTGGNVLGITGTLAQLKSGTDIELNNTSVTASIANNKIDFDLNSKDNNNRDKYHLKGLLVQSQFQNYELSLSPDNLLLNYESWTASANNKINITPGTIKASNFTLSKDGQQLTINNLSQGLKSPLQLDFTNFQLATLTGFVQTDSTLANGTINGKLLITDIATPLFTTDLVINNFSFKGDTVGNIHAIVSNKDAASYTTNIALTGRGNDVKITGTYHTGGSENFDMVLAVNTLPLKTIEAFSNNKLKGTNGAVHGKFNVRGNFQRPVINGDLTFDKAGFNFSMLNSYFSIDNETLQFGEQGIKFDRFQIRDSANNPLTINGLVATSDYLNYGFDLSIRANNFKALNSTKKDNRLFYGQLYFNTNLTVKGTATAPRVDGRLEINDKTKMTVVLPQREPGVVERDGIIEFIDIDAPLNDSLFLASYDSLNNSGFTGMDIALNINVVPEAEFSLVIDEGNGDFLNVRGNAALTAGIDPSGKILLSGSYELEQGTYELTFNFLKRKFEIEKGSRITWEGEPTDATLDIRATYIANASPLDLVKDQLGETSSFIRNTYLQKLPFDVHLDMQGKLMQPDISFDIALPENKSYAVSGDIITNVRTRLVQLRQETGEMNKQVFSLLLLNRFISENPFDVSGGGPSAGALARQSVSKLLTEQLNNLAGDLIAGVDINFDILSSEDYTTGQRKDRTDLNVGLSKRLLNDRLTVTVGSNFELEGPQQSGQQSNNIAGNLALDYRISKDNRYLLRAYRKNEYQGVIEGYIIETGVGFIMNIDYNKFKEIFISRSEREQRRIRRQEQRKIDDTQKLQQAKDTTSVSR